MTTPPRTLAELVLHIREHSAGRTDLLRIDRGGPGGGRELWSTERFVDRIHAVALGLAGRGVGAGDRVGLWSENCPEWHVLDFACQLLGAVSVPIYPTLVPAQARTILLHAEARVVVVSDGAKLHGLAELPADVLRVTLDSTVAGEGALAFDALAGEGEPGRDATPLATLAARAQPADLASLIYTSGTTGEPKGVMLTHANFVANLLAVASIFPVGPEDLSISFLPLSHVFARTADNLLFYRGVALHYVPVVERVPPALLAERPTVLPSIPRLYERAAVRIRTQLEREPGIKGRLARWALAAGRREVTRVDAGRRSSPASLVRGIFSRALLAPVRARFGGRLRLPISGGAALGREVAELFAAVGMPIYQGYGLTETSPVLSANHPGGHRLGSVGQALPGVAIRIAADGEILARGPNVMAGYWRAPEATAEVLDADGWLHTGDIGHLDGDGFLFITDRKKDLLVTSGGKNVAPQPIETALTASGLLLQAVVVGDGYPYPTALLVPNPELLAPALRALPPPERNVHPQLLGAVEALLAEVNRGLSEHERVRRFHLLDEELTQARGELTPTLKVRRRAVAERYAGTIAALYPRTQRGG